MKALRLTMEGQNWHELSLANNDLSRKSAAHDAMLKRVVKFIEEYEARGLRNDYQPINY